MRFLLLTLLDCWGGSGVVGKVGRPLRRLPHAKVSLGKTLNPTLTSLTQLLIGPLQAWNNDEGCVRSGIKSIPNQCAGHDDLLW